MADHILAFDIGTTGAKTCLFRLSKTLSLVDAKVEDYPLLTTSDGGAEQRADDWWQAMCRGTRAVLSKSRVPKENICGLSFCCQMQALILVDEAGTPVRNPMGYMDGRAADLFQKKFAAGLVKIEGMNAVKLLSSLYITGGAAATAKDPLWKYHWVREHEPELFGRASKWLDVRDYLAMRCTDRIMMTRDSAHLTFIYDTRPGREGWSTSLCRMFGVNMDHLPDVHGATDRAGSLTAGAAQDLGLVPGTPVFAGGGDVTLIGPGSGCTRVHDTHVYVGTSGWVSANVDRRMVDLKNFIASISGAFPGTYNYVAEQETSGLCLQWVRDHLALDAIGVYLDAEGDGPALDSDRLYALMNEKVLEVPPGAGGVIFTPWLHGNRSPREDPHARGIFFNIGLSTGKRAMIRAVIEGIAFHSRWMLSAVEKRVPPRDRLRLVGGGAQSAVLCQIMADVTGKIIEVPEDPRNVGAFGAAMVCAAGLGIIGSAADAGDMIRIGAVYMPCAANAPVYDRMFEVFKRLYDRNRKLFRDLNA